MEKHVLSQTEDLHGHELRFLISFRQLCGPLTENALHPGDFSFLVTCFFKYLVFICVKKGEGSNIYTYIKI